MPAVQWEDILKLYETDKNSVLYNVTPNVMKHIGHQNILLELTRISFLLAKPTGKYLSVDKIKFHVSSHASDSYCSIRNGYFRVGAGHWVL
jgi:hypothetical protein